ncbi:MAG: zinc ribbon domain-containing protein [Schwartzia sp.]|nr:zinc ribbon domain-containing protein [Schwartzia sp. (in: firmicutes)]
MKCCEECGKTYDNQAQYCSLCGKPLTSKNLPTVIQTKFCGQCGAKIEAESTACPSCGAILEDNQPIIQDIEKSQKHTEEKMSLLKNIVKLFIGILLIILFWLVVK